MTTHMKPTTHMKSTTHVKAAYRRSDIARLIMSRVHVRPRAERSPRFNLVAAKSVLSAFGRKSVWSGADDDLTIVRIDRTKPLDIDNAMVLQVREANRHVPLPVVEHAKMIVAKINKQASPEIE